MGGDEFAVVLDVDLDERQIEEIATSIRSLAAVPLRWRSHSLQFSASVGVSSRVAGLSFHIADMLSEADLALYASKSAGRNCYHRFAPAMRAEADHWVACIAMVRNALSNNELELHYQAKVSLGDRRAVGYEALLRWNSSDGMKLPGDFQSALLDPQLSVELGEFVLETAIKQAAGWVRQGFDFGSIAINMGQQQFRDPSFADRVQQAIRMNGLEPSMIEIEVTEDVFLSRGSAAILTICKALRSYGIGVSFDDFGTGFASLTHLLEFPVSAIKIDRSFVARLSTRAGTTAMIRAICEIGNAMGVAVVAEGVENEEQAAFLKSVGCDCGQGFLFHFPERADQIVGRMLRSA